MAYRQQKFSQFWTLGSPRSGTTIVWWWAFFLVHSQRLLTVSSCGRRAKDLFGIPFIKTLLPFLKTPPSWPKHLPKPHPLIPSSLGVRISTYSFLMDTHSDHSNNEMSQTGWPREWKISTKWNVKRSIRLSLPKMDTTNWWSTGRIQPPTSHSLFRAQVCMSIHTLEALVNLYFAGCYCTNSSLLSKICILHTFRLTACPWRHLICNTFIHLIYLFNGISFL